MTARTRPTGSFVYDTGRYCYEIRIMVSANQFYGMLLDENLRPVYAKQEKGFIDERISKNRIFSRFYLAYLGLYYSNSNILISYI